uniref:tRNA uridine-5-carboxymethylaminomethyl(34) synthesis GTPase MnmE n=1 Tax=Eubacterium cellulosolvens TaxID=29322 RepID=UPI00055030C0|nr:tRNA uridine-5-carboxymethylaminomethyl(34) synthesis GTPase MnmE [[Eubacterium] cellulosolvens]
MSEIYSDTIVAISTAMAPSGIGIVRVSGPDAIEIADRVYSNPKGKRLSDQKGYTIHYGNVCEKGEVIDETLAMLMRAPHSYTGEDTVEFDCHGGVLATKRVLEAIIHAGARPAEPGEFSRRAFLNGRIDLTQAEAVMDIISAKNDHALRSAQHQLKGSVSEKISVVRQKLLHETAHIEAALDDPEHMSLDGYVEEMHEVITEQKSALLRLLESADSGRFMTEGIKTVIVGKPNAGKSSLLNLLIGEEKAIVTDIAGTTRDILEEQINVKGITLRLLDTAGIRDASDVIEQIGVEKAKEQVKDADLVLYVVDGSVALDENDHEIMDLIHDRKSVVILNKNDLSTVITNEQLEEKTQAPVISMSAKQSLGLDELEEEIEKMFFHGGISFNDEVYITNVRHKTCIEEAIRSLGLVLQSMDDGMPEDFWSIDLMGACDALGKITGDTTSEDLVNEIFSSFCMGK